MGAAKFQVEWIGPTYGTAGLMFRTRNVPRVGRFQSSRSSTFFIPERGSILTEVRDAGENEFNMEYYRSVRV